MEKREILFRGKLNSNGKWVYGMPSYDLQYIFNDENLDSPDNFEVNPKTIGQFTGMTDYNGIKIFDGDIVIANCAPSGAKSKKVKDHKCCIEYSELHKGWCALILDHEPGEKWMTGYMSYGRNGSALKVIGNIHDVKEQLVNEAV